MRGVVAFDDVLDETLQGFAGESATRAQNGRAAGTAATYGFFFADAGPPRPRSDGWNVERSGGSAPDARIPGVAHVTAPAARVCTRRHVHSPVPNSHRVAASTAAADQVPATECVQAPRARRLSAVQRCALAELVGLGASLDEHFTADQLRSAFRTLARRYHPDRHAERSEAEKAELSMMFRRLYDAYRVLAPQ